MKVSECCGERLTFYNKDWDDGICSKCNEHTPAMKEEEESKCYKCDTVIDAEDHICCNCIDGTDGRNQHFWQIKNEVPPIKNEVPPKSEWKNISLKIGEHLDKTIKKEKN